MFCHFALSLTTKLGEILAHTHETAREAPIVGTTIH